MRNFSALAFLVVVLLSVQAASAQVAPGDVWKNSRGSTLTITSVDADGRFTGEYVNNAAGFGCQGTPYVAEGWMNADSIGWVVSWNNTSENCNSVTSWGGAILSPTLIETIWSLGYTSQNYGPRVTTGSDFFSKQ